MGFELLIVVGAIAFLIGFQILRALLALPFPQVSAQLMPVKTPPPEHLADLMPEIRERLHGLGFRGPRWLRREYRPDLSSDGRDFAVFWNPKTHTQALVGRCVDQAVPNEPQLRLATALADGRWVVTVLGDPVYVAIDHPQMPAQVLPYGDWAGAVGRHQALVTAQKTDVDPNGIHRSGIELFSGAWESHLADWLRAQGRIGGADTPRPGLGFALGLLKAWLRRPKGAAPKAAPVPVARLIELADIADQARRRSPTARAQLQLLVASAVLSLILGGVLFGLPLTLAIVGIILFHECGHWLAMRAFGYENTHMTLLPLVGGVAIGHENDPSAAKRAWVALAGPLPGIVLGWMLVALAVSDAGGLMTAWLWPLAGLMLLINYLNVLPVPPLDGSHILRALLPRRWLGLDAAIVLAGCVAGIALGAWMQWWALVFIVALQLFFVRRMFVNARVLRRILASGTPIPADSTGRRRLALRELEAMDGPAMIAKPRVEQCLEIENLLGMRPMGFFNRLAVGGIFAALLAVPLVAGMLGLFGIFGSEEFDAEIAQQQEQRARLSGEAATLDLDSLLAARAGEALAAPADDAALDEAQRRLAVRLPEDLAALYRISNGVDALGLVPLNQLRRLRDDPGAREILESLSTEGSFWLPTADDGEAVELSRAQADGALILAPPDNALLMLPAGDVQGWRVFDLGQQWSAYPDLRAWLEAGWVQERMLAFYERAQHERQAQAAAQLATAELWVLLDEFERPGLLVRWVAPELDWPAPASAADIAAAEDRIGRPLPADHRELLAFSNGFPPLQLLPARHIGRFGDIPAPEGESGWGADKAEALASCIAVGGTVMQEPQGIWPLLLWCPGRTPTYRPLYGDGGFASLTDYTRDVAITQRAQ